MLDTSKSFVSTQKASVLCRKRRSQKAIVFHRLSARHSRLYDFSYIVLFTDISVEVLRRQPSREVTQRFNDGTFLREHLLVNERVTSIRRITDFLDL